MNTGVYGLNDHPFMHNPFSLCALQAMKLLLVRREIASPGLQCQKMTDELLYIVQSGIEFSHDQRIPC
jgi:hypothetical protein